jgi:hypothetical protein
VQFFGFTFEDDTAFYRNNVDPNWQPQKFIEGPARSYTEPNLDEAITAIRKKIPIQLAIIGVYDPNVDSELYFMLAVASCINRRVSRVLTKEQLDSIAMAAHLRTGTACWMRSFSTYSELQDLGVPHV